MSQGVSERWLSARRQAERMRGVAPHAHDLLTLIYDMIAQREGCAAQEVRLQAIRYHLQSAEKLHKDLSEHLPGPEPSFRTGLELMCERFEAWRDLADPRAAEDPWTEPPPESGQLWRLWASLQGHEWVAVDDTLSSADHTPQTANLFHPDSHSLFIRAAQELLRRTDQLLLPAVGALEVGRHVRVRGGEHAGRTGHTVRVTWHTSHRAVTDTPASYLVDFDDIVNAREQIAPDHLEPLPSWDTNFAVVRAGEEAPVEWAAAVLLPRVPDGAAGSVVRAWQQQFLTELRQRWSRVLAFSRIVVFVPDLSMDGGGISPQDRLECERWATGRADVILRQVTEDAPYGHGCDDGAEDGRLVLAAPGRLDPSAPVHAWARQRDLQIVSGAGDAAAAVMERIGKGAKRVGGERDVPLRICRSRAFREWRLSHISSGVGIVSARVVWEHAGLSQRPGWWSLHVRLRHHRPGHASGDTLSDEVIVGRPSTLSLIAIRRHHRWTDSTVLLVRDAPASAIAPERVWFPDRGLQSFDGPMLGLPAIENEDKNGNFAERTLERILRAITYHTGVTLDVPDDPLHRWFPQNRQDTNALLAEGRTVRYDLTQAQADELLTATADPTCRYGIYRVADLLANRTVDWATLGKITRAAVPTFPPTGGDLDSPR